MNFSNPMQTDANAPRTTGAGFFPSSGFSRARFLCLISAFCFLLSAFTASAANVRTYFINTFTGDRDTNYVVATKISSNILSSGGVIAQGIPTRLIMTNGASTNFFAAGFYSLVNSSLGKGVVINVSDNGAQLYDYTNLLYSGFNTYATVYGSNLPPTYDNVTNALGFLPLTPTQTTNAILQASNSITANLTNAINGTSNSITANMTNYVSGIAATLQAEIDAIDTGGGTNGGSATNVFFLDSSTINWSTTGGSNVAKLNVQVTNQWLADIRTASNSITAATTNFVNGRITTTSNGLYSLIGSSGGSSISNAVARQEYFYTNTANLFRSNQFTFSGGGMSGQTGYAPGASYGSNEYVLDLWESFTGNPDFLTATQLFHHISLFATNQLATGHTPAGINQAGALQTAGYAYHSDFSLVELAFIHFRKTDHPFIFTNFQANLSNAMNYVQKSNNIPSSFGTNANYWDGWGLVEIGYNSYSAAQYKRCCDLMAIMAMKAGQPLVASNYYWQSQIVRSSMTNLWDETRGLLRTCSQGTTMKNTHSLVANSLAVLYDAADDRIKNRIEEEFVKFSGHNNGFFQYGALRTTPIGECLDAAIDSDCDGTDGSGTYQTGGYWPLTWGVEVVARRNPDVAEAMMKDMYSFGSQSNQFYEWWNVSADLGITAINKGSSNYTASSGIPATYLLTGKLTDNEKLLLRQAGDNAVRPNLGLVAGSNITLTPGAAGVSIASTGGGSSVTFNATQFGSSAAGTNILNGAPFTNTYTRYDGTSGVQNVLTNTVGGLLGLYIDYNAALGFHFVGGSVYAPIGFVGVGTLLTSLNASELATGYVPRPVTNSAVKTGDLIVTNNARISGNIDVDGTFTIGTTTTTQLLSTATGNTNRLPVWGPNGNLTNVSLVNLTLDTGVFPATLTGSSVSGLASTNGINQVIVQTNSGVVGPEFTVITPNSVAQTNSSRYVVLTNGTLSVSGNVILTGSSLLTSSSDVILRSAGNGSTYLQGSAAAGIRITQNGHLLTSTDNTLDFGTNTTGRLRNMFVATGINVGSRSNSPPSVLAYGATLWSDGTNLCVIIRNHATGVLTTNKITMSAWP